MAIIKHSVCSQHVVTSSAVYVCSSCGKTEMMRDDDMDSSVNQTKKCNACNGDMYLVSAHAREVPNN